MTRSGGRALAARNQLRVRVLVGVVAVTLVALAAFDFTAVTTMRGYLYGQARSQLSGATPDLGELQALTSSGYTALPGQYDMIWLPAHGEPDAIQLLFNGPGAATVIDAVGRTGPAFSTVRIAGQQMLVHRTGFAGSSGFPGGSQLRVGGTGFDAGVGFPGGTLFTSSSLAPVTSAVARIELIIVAGSAVVVLLIGAGVFLVLRRGLRPVEAMAAQADRITAGDLADRVAPHDRLSEVGRLGTALNGMLTRIEGSVREREAPARSRCAGSSPTPATSCAPRSPRCSPTPSCTSTAP